MDLEGKELVSRRLGTKVKENAACKKGRGWSSRR